MIAPSKALAILALTLFLAPALHAADQTVTLPYTTPDQQVKLAPSANYTSATQTAKPPPHQKKKTQNCPGVGQPPPNNKPVVKLFNRTTPKPPFPVDYQPATPKVVGNPSTPPPAS